MNYKEIIDLQDLEANGGFSKWHRYVSPDGKRQDAAHRYIHPLLQSGSHPNLHLLLESKVLRVIFDSSSPPKAIGIEYISSPSHAPEVSLSAPDAKPVRKVVKASKLVVVTAGALGTPQILERSGVGNPEILKKVGVPVVADVKGVGENYQDHHLVLYPYKSNLDENETLDGLLSGRKDFVKALTEKDPMLGWNGIGMFFPLAFPPSSLSYPIFQAPNVQNQTSAPSSAPPPQKSPPSAPNSKQTGTRTSRPSPRNP
jgi:choline dehydrogenase-like flavoprotein